jgi:hypothetical protein
MKGDEEKKEKIDKIHKMVDVMRSFFFFVVFFPLLISLVPLFLIFFSPLPLSSQLANVMKITSTKMNNTFLSYKIRTARKSLCPTKTGKRSLKASLFTKRAKLIWREENCRTLC